MSSQFINSKLKQSFLERILRSISINVFCDDPSKIAKPNENLKLVNRATNWHKSSLLLWLIFVNFNLFHWTRVKKKQQKQTDYLSSLIEEFVVPRPRLDVGQLFLSRLDWKVMTEVGQLNFLAFTWEQIKVIIFSVLMVSYLAT